MLERTFCTFCIWEKKLAASLREKDSLTEKVCALEKALDSPWSSMGLAFQQKNGHFTKYIKNDDFSINSFSLLS